MRHIRKWMRKGKKWKKTAAEECNNKRMNAAGISQHRKGIDQKNEKYVNRRKR